MRERQFRILYMAHVRWFNAEAQYALDLAEACRKKGHCVFYFTQGASPAAAKARERGIKTFEESGFNAKGLRGAVGIFSAMVRLADILKRYRIDAVEVFRPEGFALIAGVCRLLGIPVVRVRGDMRAVRKDILNRLLYKKGASRVVASNAAIADQLQQRLGPMRSVETIHGGVDADVFRPEGSVRDIRSELRFPADGFLVGILGRLGERKGHADLIVAARALLAGGKGVYFVILAKEHSPMEAELRKQIEAAPGLDRQIGFLRFQSNLPAVLRAFDLGVVASTGSEANCRVGLEWMASGIPLVGTRIGVLPDLIDNGRSGLLVPPQAPEKLAEKIGYLADHPDEARKMGLHSRKRVMECFTLEKCASKHLALIRQSL